MKKRKGYTWVSQQDINLIRTMHDQGIDASMISRATRRSSHVVNGAIKCDGTLEDYKKIAYAKQEPGIPTQDGEDLFPPFHSEDQTIGERLKSLEKDVAFIVAWIQEQQAAKSGELKKGWFSGRD